MQVFDVIIVYAATETGLKPPLDLIFLSGFLRPGGAVIFVREKRLR